MLLAVCQELEIEVDENVIPRIAFGFAGGIGNTGGVCGAVAGGVMAISLALDKGATMGEVLGKLNTLREFRSRFEAEMGTISCRELTGLDLSKEEGRERLISSDIPERVCFPAVGTSYKLAVELLETPT